MDSKAANNLTPIEHPRLGTVRWHSEEELWFAEVDRSRVWDGQVGIATTTDLDAAADFLDWLPRNWELFRASAAYQTFNYDLIWNDELDEGELAAKLAIKSMTVRRGEFDLWLDTGGATTDHLLRARLDSADSGNT